MSLAIRLLLALICSYGNLADAQSYNDEGQGNTYINNPFITGTIECGPSNGSCAFNSANFSGSLSVAGSTSLNSTNITSLNISQGVPWVDITASEWGAVADGSTDNTTAIQNAVNFIQNTFGSGIIFIPPASNVYCIKTSGGVSVSGSGMQIWGASTYGNSTLSACGTDTKVLVVSGKWSQLRNFSIFGKGVNNDTGSFGASQNALEFTATCISCSTDTLVVNGGFYGIKLDNGSNDVYLHNTSVSLSYASFIYAGVSGYWFDRLKLDQNWPYAEPAFPYTVNAWQANTAVTAGQIVTTQNVIIQYMTSGTSGSSAPTLKNFGITISDGSATAQLARATTNYYAIICAGCFELQMTQIDMSGSMDGLWMTTSNLGAGGGTSPQFVKCYQCIAGQNLNTAVQADYGQSLWLTDSEFGGCVKSGCSPVIFNSSFAGDGKVHGGKYWGAYDGIVMGGSTGPIEVTGATLEGTNAGFDASVGASYFYVAGNTIGANNDSGTSIGVQVRAGGSDHYTIGPNICFNVTTCVSDGGTGTHKTVNTGN